jgi:hypothetical protein
LRDSLDAISHGLLNFEIPEADYNPPNFLEGGLRKPISLLGSSDLDVPICARLAEREVVGVAVPETAIDEHSYAPPRER